MKKLFLTAVVAVIAISASAQAYVGAGVGFWRNYDANRTTFNLAPEAGYALSDTWAIGIALNYKYEYNNGVKNNGFAVNPYVRYTVAKMGAFKFFVDGSVQIDALSTTPLVGDSYSGTAWQVGFKPGIAVDLGKQFTLATHVGFLGYRDCNDDYDKYGFPTINKGFGFNVTNEIGSVSIYYNF